MGQGDLVSKDLEMTEVLNAAFTLVFASKIWLQESQASESSGKLWHNEDLPLVKQDQVI